jgi:hypothetical protein
VLEDFDAAHSDLVAAILTLAKTGEYKQSSCRGEEDKCAVNQACRIVATTFGASTLNLIRDYPYVIVMEPLSSEDLSLICSLQFPLLEPIKEKVLRIFNEICVIMKSASSSTDRKLNSR